MEEINMLKALRTDLLKFFDQLIESFPGEGDLIIARFFIADKFPIEDIMAYICTTLLPLKEMVDTKNDKFFLEHNILFEELDDCKVNKFKEIWQSDLLEDEDKDNIWKWFSRFLVRADHYTRYMAANK